MKLPEPVNPDARAYVPPVRAAHVDLLLDANEGGPADAGVMRALGALSAEDLLRYPDVSRAEARIVAGLGVSVDRVMLTNGGDEAIDRVCRAFLCEGRSIVAHVPTFPMIGKYAALARARVDSVSWSRGAFPLDEFVGAVGDDAAVLAVVTPNNPTGLVVAEDQLLELAAVAAERGAVLMVDLAYVEFADHDPTGALLEFPNVVMIRTFSKAFGLAGVRAGFAVGSAEVIGAMRAAGGPFTVATPTVAAVEACLEGATERVAGIRDGNARRRASLVRTLEDVGLHVTPSEGNFVLARTARRDVVHAGLYGLGISVRRFGDADGLGDALRITVPADDGELARLERGLRSAAAPECVLLDMDGVIADVSRSYRDAIVATAAGFGVEVTAEDVRAAKAAGNANNDWELTRALVARGGVSASLDEVRARFQALYLGDGVNEGLRESEALIPSLMTLERLAGKLPVGVVTGRPRDEARWFLERFGIGGLVRTVVGMEDAAAKPSPEPVELAMERLGVSSGWLVGDTPDDVVAARAAGVVPVGVCAPGEETPEGRAVLEGAGAAFVVGSLDELEGMLL